MQQTQQTKAQLLASVIMQLNAQDRAVNNIWARLSGILLSEARLLWDKGYDVDTLTLIKALRTKLSELIETEEKERQQKYPWLHNEPGI